jgi:hypothetical protein
MIAAVFDLITNYIGFTFIVVGFLLYLRTSTSIITQIGSSVRKFADIDGVDWFELGISAIIILAGYLITKII